MPFEKLKKPARGYKVVCCVVRVPTKQERAYRERMRKYDASYRGGRPPGRSEAEERRIHGRYEGRLAVVELRIPAGASVFSKDGLLLSGDDLKKRANRAEVVAVRLLDKFSHRYDRKSKIHRGTGFARWSSCEAQRFFPYRAGEMVTTRFSRDPQPCLGGIHFFDKKTDALAWWRKNVHHQLTPMMLPAAVRRGLKL